jgi:hypothetical protein
MRGRQQLTELFPAGEPSKAVDQPLLPYLELVHSRQLSKIHKIRLRIINEFKANIFLPVPVHYIVIYRHCS